MPAPATPRSTRSSAPVPVSTRHPRAATRPAGRGDKREPILRAAIKVFADRGFFNAQVADVAREAHVAAGTVYLYFRSKDDLIEAMVEQDRAESLARIAAIEVAISAGWALAVRVRFSAGPFQISVLDRRMASTSRAVVAGPASRILSSGPTASS